MQGLVFIAWALPVIGVLAVLRAMLTDWASMAAAIAFGATMDLLFVASLLAFFLGWVEGTAAIAGLVGGVLCGAALPISLIRAQRASRAGR